MSTPKQRLRQTEANWFQVMRSYYLDMAATQSVDEAREIEANYHRAESAYLDAIDTGLRENGPRVEAAYETIKAANEAVKAARAEAVGIKKLLRKLKSATRAAEKLVKFAG